MDRKREHLAQVDRHIADCKAHIAHQREIIQYAPYPMLLSILARRKMAGRLYPEEASFSTMSASWEPRGRGAQRTLATTAFPTIDLQEERRRSKWEVHMTIRRLALVLCCLGFAAAVHELHAQAKPEAMTMTPPEMKWGAQGSLAMAGLEQVNLVGNPSKPGPYTLRLKFPAGYKLAPHTHPDYREVTVLSGTWYTGYGEKFDEAALKALPAGSFYTEPANVAHFVEVREPVVIQVSGSGPSGRRFVDPAGDPK